MYEIKKKLERYLRVNLLGPGPRLLGKKEFTGPRSDRGSETLLWTARFGRVYGRDRPVMIRTTQKTLEYTLGNFKA